MQPQVLSNKEEMTEIMSTAHQACVRTVIVSQEDTSLAAFVSAAESIPLNKRLFRPILVVSLQHLLSENRSGSDAAALLRSIIVSSRSQLGGIACLMLRAPYCEAPGEQEHRNSSASCQRTPNEETGEKFLPVWQEARKLWTEGLVYSVGVRDFSAPELQQLAEWERAQEEGDTEGGSGTRALQVVQVRVDPFFRWRGGGGGAGHLG